jgi:5'-3' exoribonuclease 1
MYYEKKVGIDSEDPEQMKALLLRYIESLQWVYTYYFKGCPSWQWFYPYHYAPIAIDIKNIGELSKEIKFEKGRPFRPFEQLLGVLPPKSAHLLPEEYQKLILDPNSPIKDFYPETFKIDTEDAKYDWEGVVILPFIDEERLLKEVEKIDESKLPKEVLDRNKFGITYIFRYDKYVKSYCKSTLPAFLSDIVNCHCVVEEFKMPKTPEGEGFKAELLEGVKLGKEGLEGFPSFTTKPHEGSIANVGVTVFGMKSKKTIFISYNKTRSKGSRTYCR